MPSKFPFGIFGSSMSPSEKSKQIAEERKRKALTTEDAYPELPTDRNGDWLLDEETQEPYYRSHEGLFGPGGGFTGWCGRPYPDTLGPAYQCPARDHLRSK